MLVVMNCCTYFAPLTTLVWPTSSYPCAVWNHLLLRRFTFMSMCGMNTSNRCPYLLLSFPTYYPDTGTGSDSVNRTFVGPLTQPLLKHTSQRLTPLHTLPYS